MRHNRLVAATFSIGLLISPSAYADDKFDDLGDSWYSIHINALATRGYIDGDGKKFKPAENLTRAELARWLARVGEIESQPLTEPEKIGDVAESDKFYKAVQQVVKHGWMDLDDNGNFHPKDNVTRGEMISTIGRALKLPEPTDSMIAQELQKFGDDSEIPDTQKTMIAQASKAGIIVDGPQLQGFIRAKNSATRGETAAILNKFEEYRTRARVTQSDQEHSSADSQTKAADGTQPFELAASLDVVPGQTGEAVPSIIAPVRNPIKAIIETSISSQDKVNKHVTAIIDEPMIVDGYEVLPRRSRLHGHISNVVSAKRFFGAPARVDVRFKVVDYVDFQGRFGRSEISAKVDTTKTRLKGGTAGDRARNLTTNAVKGYGIGSMIGSVAGSIASAATGYDVTAAATLGGGLVGAITGAGVTKGEEVFIAPGTLFCLELDRAFKVPMYAQEEEIEIVTSKKSTDTSDSGEVKDSGSVRTSGEVTGELRTPQKDTPTTTDADKGEVHDSPKVLDSSAVNDTDSGAAKESKRSEVPKDSGEVKDSSKDSPVVDDSGEAKAPRH